MDHLTLLRHYTARSARVSLNLLDPSSITLGTREADDTRMLHTLQTEIFRGPAATEELFIPFEIQ